MDVNKLNLVLESLLGSEMNDWEREELAEKLADVPEQIVREILKSLPVIWPVSYALFLAFVDQAVKAGTCLLPHQYGDWVKAILDVYESEGLRQAQLFMEKVEENYLCRLQGQGGMQLAECEARLLLYARSILGRDVTLCSGNTVSFDTKTLELPPESIDSDTPQKGFLFYKFTVTFQLYLDILGTYRFPVRTMARLGLTKPRPQHYAAFFQSFSSPELIHDLFLVAEAARIMSTLHHEYPGLMRDVRDTLEFSAKGETSGFQDQNAFVAGVQYWLLHGCLNRSAAVLNDERVPEALQRQYRHGSSVGDSLKCAQGLYAACACLPGSYSSELSLPFIGRFRFSEAKEHIEQRREELQEKFMEALGAQMHDELQKNTGQEDPAEPGKQGLEEGAGALLAMAAESGDVDEVSLGQDQEHFRIGTMEVEVSEELLALAKELFREFGKIPGNLIAGAAGRAGDLFDEGSGESLEDGEPQPVNGALAYDEWDYRRAGYRKNWCKVLVKDIQPLKGTFVDTTLRKHKGLLVTLRRQFEMMAVREKFEKRQRDGDEIDLDALIDSVSDTRAGLAPSERLYSRLQRNDRQIAALFLVDMSSSTEGWVSTALKEALILMSESLAVLGDRYAIYGFSGMRRTRSELFAVKDFNEPYGEAVKNKIAGITPKEYTRMAPAIRHASHLLEDTEAKIRLLITLSDGKPEDYDGYKGIYAIEDTRHALIEAKNLGVHPFCITVDKKAHDYMAHMYGEVNYIFIDKLAQLPLKIPEIYRNLTT